MGRYKYFCSLVRERVDARCVVLEVGAGLGLCRYVKEIKTSVQQLIGVDPSPNIRDNPYVHKRIQSYFEEASQPSASIDLIYSIFVMEHIDKPEKFFLKAYEVLKSDGKMLFITPNKLHYFVLFSRLADKINIKTFWIERIMRSRVNRDFGFPSFYMVNDTSSIRNLASACGFRHCKITFRDSPRDIAIYLPKGMKWIPFVISVVMRFFKVPETYYSDIIAEVTK